MKIYLEQGPKTPYITTMNWAYQKAMQNKFGEGRDKIDPALWPASIEAARAIQNELRHQVRLTDDYRPLRTIAGVDVGYDMERNLGRASIVVVDATSLELLTTAQAYLTPGFPYVPGFLSFREIPVVLKALACLPVPPDLLMVDGQGVAHPRRLGIAAHLGVVTGLPSIGVAKSLLTGIYDEPGPEKGAQVDLLDRTTSGRIGTVLRSRDCVKPLYISPGHRVSQDRAVEIVRRCVTKYRLPEPTRLADKLSKTIRDD